MNTQELIKILSNRLSAKSSEWQIDLAFLYGSWAAKRARKDSDVDIAVLFSEKLHSEDKMLQLMIDMSVELGQLAGKEVNVIRLDREFDKPMLYYNASVKGLPLYIRDELAYRRFISEAVSQMEDFCIFGVAWQILAARNNLRRMSQK